MTFVNHLVHEWQRKAEERNITTHHGRRPDTLPDTLLHSNDPRITAGKGCQVAHCVKWPSNDEGTSSSEVMTRQILNRSHCAYYLPAVGNALSSCQIVIKAN